MPTVALESLLPPAHHLSPSKLLLFPPPTHDEQSQEVLSPRPPMPMKPCYYISPALFTTPISSPAASTHPYLLNRKGLRAANHVEHDLNAATKEEDLAMEEAAKKDEGEDDTRSVTSECSVGLGSQMTPSQLTRTEFYDAAEDFFSDSSVSQSSVTSKCSQIELRALRLNLFEETARRTLSEESLLLMQNQLQSMVKSLAELHVSMPVSHHVEGAQFEADPAQLCQEIVVLSFVSEGIEKTMAQVEAEAVAEEVIDSKNNEISRLRDRLQYYETVNREMSLRNQEVMEMARQRRLNRKRRQRWLWGGVGLAVTVGASWLAHSCLSNTTEKSSSTSSCSRSAESGA